MSSAPIHGNQLTEVVEHCQDHCMGPDGPGGKLKSQVDKWIGAFALGWKVVTIALVLLTASVTVAIAISPSLVRSSVAASAKEVVPPLVDSAVAAALRRHGLVELAPAEAPTAAVVQAPSAPWLFHQVHAETT